MSNSPPSSEIVESEGLWDPTRLVPDSNPETTVVCTHLHIDHVGFNTVLDGDRWRPTFPNARLRLVPLIAHGVPGWFLLGRIDHAVFRMVPPATILQPSTARLTGRAIASLAFVTAASMVAQGFGRFTYPVLLDAINDDVLQSYTRAGLLGTTSLVAYLLGTAAVSVASTRVEPIALVKWGLTLSTLGLGLLAVAPGFAMLAVALFIAGLGGAGVWVPAPGIAATAVGPERSGLAIGLVGSGIGLGIVVAGPLTNLVRWLADDEGAWRPVYVVEAAVALVVLLGVLTIVRLPKTGTNAARVELSVLQSVPGWRWLVAAFAVFGVSYSLYFYFLVAQLRETGWSSSGSAYIFTIVGINSAVGGIAFGRLSDRYGRPRMMLVGFLLLAASPLLTLSGQPVLVVAAAFSFGLCVAGTPTSIAGIVADNLEGRAFGAAFGILTLVFGLAQVLGPPFAGVMAESTGSFAIPFLIASVFALGGVGCAIALWQRPN